MTTQPFRAGLPLLLLLALPAACNDDSTEPDLSAVFNASLAGSAEVPPVTTTGGGTAVFELNEAENAINYTLTLATIPGVTVSHIHFGAAGANGPVIVFLYGPVNAPGLTVGSSQVVKSGTITAADVSAAAGFDGTFARLVQEMRAGNTYVNVHSVTNPGGMIRGQIVLQ